MKVVSWILFVLSILILPIFAIMGALQITEDTMTSMILMGAIGFVFFGFISHILISFSKHKDDKDGKVLFILTYPAFFIPVIILGLILVLLVCLDWMIYFFTEKHYLAQGVKWCVDNLIKGNNQSRNKEEEKSEKIYVVYEDGYRRELTFIERKTDYDSQPPYYGKDYNRFRDDLGYIWRSYDKNKTFIKEKLNGNLTYGK